MKKIMSIVLVLAVLLTAFASFALAEDSATLAAIKAKGVLVMGTDAAWAPFEYIGEGGEPDGADIELGKYIAEAFGVELKVDNRYFDTLIPALTGNEIDLAIAAITITEERKEAVNFTDAYTVAQQYVVVKADDDTVATFEDLAGKAIGVHLGTTGDFVISDAINLPDGKLFSTGATVIQYKSLPDGALAMNNGELQAIVCDTLLAKNLAAVNGFKCFPLVDAEGNCDIENLGVAMKKGDDAFLAEVNAIVAQAVAEGKIDAWILDHTEKASKLN